ncbi:MAG: ribosome maturation factor RimM [Betaproteobacteria bacterium]|nr:ribosome maturation factor RimM [Betaproteobacteria bacterium]
MGRVTAPFGVKGWFKVHALTAQPGNLCEYPVWWLRREGEWREMKVAVAKVQGNTLVAQLAGIEDREAAAALKGFEIGVPREQLPDAKGGEFYWADLIGLRVVNKEQEELGRVARIIETGANDVLVVTQDGAGGEEILIPFIADAIKAVDVAAGVIAVDWGRDY